MIFTHRMIQIYTYLLGMLVLSSCTWSIITSSSTYGYFQSLLLALAWQHTGTHRITPWVTTYERPRTTRDFIITTPKFQLIILWPHPPLFLMSLPFDKLYTTCELSISNNSRHCAGKRIFMQVSCCIGQKILKLWIKINYILTGFSHMSLPHRQVLRYLSLIITTILWMICFSHMSLWWTINL